MNIEQIKQTIEFLPTLIIYIAPGYITLWNMSFLYSIENGKDKYIVLKSIILSYIYISVVKIFMDPVIGYGKIVIFIIAIATGYIVYYLSTLNWLMDIIGFKRSLNTLALDDIVDVRNGPWVFVSNCEEELIYKGQIVHYKKIKGDEKENYYIVLQNYIILNYFGDVIEEHKEGINDLIMVRTDNASSIQFYGPNKL